jgi:ribosomal protein S18 acetylase RimI-like enzyme
MTITATTARHEHPQPATDADITEVADSLAAAFLDDPVLSWCYPDLAHRRQTLPEFFRVVVDAYLVHGGVYTTPAHVAAAVWVPPSADVDEDKLGSHLGRVSGGDAERLYTLLELLEAHHPHDAAHQYLFVLGTRPERQNLGIGSRMLRVVLADCDRDGMPGYLEASTERNKRLYERHGFKVTEVLSLPNGPNIWCMWRPA